MFRELDLNAKQVVFMNGNETVVTDGVAEYSFLYDHSFWSMDKNQGILQLCDFSCSNIFDVLPTASTHVFKSLSLHITLYHGSQSITLGDEGEVAT